MMRSSGAARPGITQADPIPRVVAFDMPGTGIPGYLRKAVSLAKAGIFDLRIHHDQVLLPILRHWGILELDGLDDTAKADRDPLVAYLGELDASARRFVERRSERSA